MGFKEIGDKINEATDTGNSWINDPKNKSAVGALTLVAIIIFMGILCRPFTKTSSKPANQTSAKTSEVDWEKVDRKNLELIIEHLSKTPEVGDVLQNIGVRRSYSSSVTYNFNFKSEASELPTSAFETVIRTWCITIAKIYKNEQWVTVNAMLLDTTIARAEFSPLTQQVKLK